MPEGAPCGGEAGKCQYKPPTERRDKTYEFAMIGDSVTVVAATLTGLLCWFDGGLID